MAPPGLIYDPIFLEHETGRHPENAGRLRAVMELIEEQLPSGVLRLDASPATTEAIDACHDPGYVRALERFARQGGGYVTADTIVGPRSFEVARMAAGACVRAVEAVVAGETRSAMAVVRPPGHHACTAAGMGFCLLSNAAIAARDAVRRLGLRRVLLLDFDVHHGNGTQEILWTDPTVCYVSLHQYPAYPGTGALDEVGEGAGKGFTANLPLPGGVGDETYLSAFDALLAPLAHRFQPELILASAGYDAHWTNSAYLSSIEMRVSVAGFGAMVRHLRNWAEALCDGRLALVLEGGYDPQALAWSVLTTLRVLRDEPVLDPLGPPDDEETPDLSRLWAAFLQLHG
jgi:acetoin utilization deacetylase AcuC-like enzyme